MVTNIELVELGDLIEESEEKTKNLLRSFVCSKDQRLEAFLHDKAIESNKRNQGRTYLLLEESTGNLLGYFTLTNKIFLFSSEISKSLKQTIIGDKNADSFSTTLIANLAKNDSFKDLISGKELMSIALDQCLEVKRIIALNLVTVEYEDNEPLIKYYKDNGFKDFQKNGINNLRMAYIKI